MNMWSFHGDVPKSSLWLSILNLNLRFSHVQRMTVSTIDNGFSFFFIMVRWLLITDIAINMNMKLDAFMDKNILTIET